jgi:hypothetical protein
MAAAFPTHTNFIATLPSMDQAADKRKLLVLDALDLTAGTDSQAVAAAALRTWKRLAAHLTPLVGEVGFCALYARAVHLAGPGSAAFAGGPAKTVDALFATLETQFATAGSAITCDDVVSFLEVFVQLLAGLIGEALTLKILASAWAGSAQHGNTPGRGI